MCEMLAQEFGLGRFDGRHCHQRLVRSLRVILPLFSLSDSPMFSCRLASYTRTTFVVKGRAIACFTRKAPFPKTPKPLLISASLRLQAAKVKVWVSFDYGLQTIFLMFSCKCSQKPDRGLMTQNDLLLPPIFVLFTFV